MNRLRWFLTVPLAIILVVFAVSNRHLVDVSLWPLDFTLSWPLFVFVYIAVIAGFLAGAVIAWASAVQRHRRSRRRRADREAQTVDVAHHQVDAEATPGAGTTPPALID